MKHTPEGSLDAYRKVREKMLAPVPLPKEESDPIDADPAGEETPLEKKLEYFALNASMLFHQGVQLIVMLEMAKENNVNVDEERAVVNSAFKDFYAIGSSEQSLRKLKETTGDLFWSLRRKVANDELSFKEVLWRTEDREHTIVKERNQYLGGE